MLHFYFFFNALLTEGKRKSPASRLSPHPFENDDALLVVVVGGDVEHGPSIAWHDGVLHFRILPDVQVVGFDSSHSRTHRGGLGDSEVKEACQQSKHHTGLVIVARCGVGKRKTI